MKRILWLLLVLMLIPATAQAKPIKVKSITVEPKALVLHVGETHQLAATIHPENADNKNINWGYHYDENLLSISETGEMTALAVGVTAPNVCSEDKGAVCMLQVRILPSLETQAGYPEEVVRLVNAERDKKGLPPLAVDEDLLLAAGIRAKELIDKFSHTRPDGTMCTTVSPKAIGENVTYGANNPDHAMEIWMDGAGHEESILSKDYRTIGVGLAEGADGTLYWAQVFGE